VCAINRENGVFNRQANFINWERVLAFGVFFRLGCLRGQLVDSAVIVMFNSPRVWASEVLMV
jgi:hypothetical protein